jgi:hypothetical protein
MATGTFYPLADTDVGIVRTDDYSYHRGDASTYYYFQASYNLVCRFGNINIPKGSTINSAYIKLYSYGTMGDGQNMARRIGASNEDNPDAIASWNDWNTRTWTSIVEWLTGYWSAPADHTANNSPDIKSVIQGIVNRTGWSSNNHLLLAMSPPGYGTSGNYLQVYMSGGYYPELHIDWTPALSNIEVEFSSHPLEITDSINFEAHCLDFGLHPLEVQNTMVLDPLHSVNIYFENYPFNLVSSGVLVNFPNPINMVNAPLVFNGSIPSLFSIAGQNAAHLSLPALFGEASGDVHSCRVDGLFIPFPRMVSSGLVGEIAEASGVIATPRTIKNMSGYSNEFGRAGLTLAALLSKGLILPGVVGASGLVLPALRIIGSSYLIPIAQAGSFLASLYGSASGSQGFQAAQRVFKAIVMNLKNRGVTEYQNFNFNSLAFFNGFFLGANENGIFILSGPDDAGTEIPGTLSLPPISLGNIVPGDLWLSMRNSKPLKVRIEENEGQDPFTYSINADPQATIHLERVKFGRGLGKRRMQLTITNTGGGSMDIDGLMITPNPMKRSKS